MSDSDNLRVRIVKLPAALAEAMLYHGLSANDPSFASVLAQSETVLIKGASPPAADQDIVAATGDQPSAPERYACISFHHTHCRGIHASSACTPLLMPHE